VLDLLFPRRCVACGVTGETLCGRCRDALPRLREPLCERCGAPTAWPVKRCSECSGRRLAFASARAAVAYDERVRKLVAAWKEHGLRRLGDVAAELVAQLAPPEAAAITWVPPDPDRALKRADHPPESLSRRLGARWEVPALELLRRTRPARRQRGSSLADRRSNVRGAFAATAQAPGRILLIDDVYTSGATANAAASALRGAGATRVDVITFARTLRN
jgi:predicted amidophosphoribosyltransferase